MLAVLKVLTKVNTLYKDYVVIIAKRIHLFPFRTQKLSSLALMVLGGKLPGRVGHSQVMCRSGGTGRRTGLKILRNLYFRTGSIPVFGTKYSGPLAQLVRAPGS